MNPSAQKKLGVIGLGKMGRHLAGNLLGAGFSIVVCDVVPAAAEALQKAGAQRAFSPREVAQNSEVVVLSLPDSAALSAVVAGEDGLCSTDLDGVTIIDTSTVTLRVAQECARLVEERGGAMLDAPVTGGTLGAQKGELALFVGGDEAAFEAQRAVFAPLGTPTYIGPSGHGQVGKMVCQMIGSVTYAVNAEALALCDNLSVDAARVAGAFDGGARLGRMVEMRQSGEFGSGGYTAQRGKDLDCALEAALHAHTFMPVTSAVQALFALARQAGLGDADPDALFRVWERLHESGNND